ncbi:HipA N-terminal domain-containing protein [Fusibacter bizertensis]|uniref:HipA N-terminal domain-containing protein n=1 Tax=Fusibacter bizertensis TaxID=1488331 RepID=A0ABT6NCL2_9FIRM|nr:HipA N-terminal domain-containing protein [Fusibacter bizertensis]MDH8678152.1 HipA N-terminal domain-containing protein [Fusibacter bizertensis]
MSKFEGRDYLYVVWKSPDNGARIVIGKLSKNGCYEFIYNEKEISRACKNGFEPLVAFPEFSKEYKNDEVFPTFSSRLPDKRRKDIQKILQKYEMDNYDSFELLRKSGGKLPTDTLEFIDPILSDDVHSIVREFYIAGTRYRDLCDSETYPECILKIDLVEGEALIVVHDIDNQFDENAILLLKNSDKREKIGYIPAYFSEAVLKALKSDRKVTCVVKEFSRENCQECVKVKMVIH